MNKELARLAARRAALAERAESQRKDLAHALEPWRTPLALADRGMAAFRFIRRHKALAAAVLGAAVALRPKSTAGWLRKGWLVWRIVLRVRQSLHG